ncbi:macrophage mannose receptor 1-like [Pygocentrus nattereri]|uniref:macrophage mannose receptor 1-like n=1 Tax=Pygocentrus nattereri TaxID=42514 RepID=UPI00189196BF|nr:macrophage mannose receptor 1-like [Pygocentrus nattereri]
MATRTMNIPKELWRQTDMGCRGGMKQRTRQARDIPDDNVSIDGFQTIRANPGCTESAVCGVSAYVPRQYVFVNESKIWTEAQSYCRQTYTDLATINGNFYRDGDTYRNWRRGEPNNAGNRDEYCVAMFKDTGDWFDYQCKALYSFVCYNEKKTSTERYVFINETKNWHDAQSYCRERHTDLVSVRNQTENQLIFNLSKINSNVHIWIGLFNDSWQWSDQSDSSFRYWMSGPENYGQGEMCAAVFEQGYWNNVACNNKLPFFCYENKLILIKENLTWKEALRHCRVKHVDLVSVHSEEIQLWVKEVAQNASTEHVWLGLRHTCTLSFWFWVSGESICYQNWAPGNGTGGEDCSPVERTGAVQARGGQQWVSLPEDQKRNFICLTYEG